MPCKGVVCHRRKCLKVPLPGAGEELLWAGMWLAGVGVGVERGYGLHPQQHKNLNPQTLSKSSHGEQGCISQLRGEA